MVAGVHKVPLPYWVAAYRLVCAPGGRYLTPTRLQQELSLPSKKAAGRILNEVRRALAYELPRRSPSRPEKQPFIPGESWLLADTFWDHNG
jgi:hypothetical protein